MRATARVPTRPLSHPRPYYERCLAACQTISVVIVRAGEEWMWGGDPCGRPRSEPTSGRYIPLRMSQRRQPERQGDQKDQQTNSDINQPDILCLLNGKTTHQCAHRSCGPC